MFFTVTVTLNRCQLARLVRRASILGILPPEWGRLRTRPWNWACRSAGTPLSPVPHHQQRRNPSTLCRATSPWARAAQVHQHHHLPIFTTIWVKENNLLGFSKISHTKWHPTFTLRYVRCSKSMIIRTNTYTNNMRKFSEIIFRISEKSPKIRWL